MSMSAEHMCYQKMVKNPHQYIEVCLLVIIFYEQSFWFSLNLSFVVKVHHLIQII